MAAIFVSSELANNFFASLGKKSRQAASGSRRYNYDFTLGKNSSASKNRVVLALGLTIINLLQQESYVSLYGKLSQ